ncbi:MAG: flagellar motor protein MotB [Candidatus Glassbacteria bacterium]|nr:flagellar motor protein MotB [Candidatus Glassbacteria bacterium]
MAKDKCPECVAGAPAWLTTFSDLMSLLLCFFVLIVSMSTIQERDFWVAAGSLRGAFGVMSASPAIIRLENVPLPTLKNIQRAIIDKSISNLQDFIESKNLGESVKVVIEDKGVALSISAPVLFETGGAEMNPASYPLLEEVFNIARGWPNVIRVEGHTDNARIAGGEFETNWDLSFARALGVVNFATQFSKIHPSRLAPVAYGQYHPVADNETPEGRAENRRIEIFMEYKKETEDPFK